MWAIKKYKKRIRGKCYQDPQRKSQLAIRRMTLTANSIIRDTTDSVTGIEGTQSGAPFGKGKYIGFYFLISDASCLNPGHISEIRRLPGGRRNNLTPQTPAENGQLITWRPASQLCTRDQWGTPSKFCTDSCFLPFPDLPKQCH